MSDIKDLMGVANIEAIFEDLTDYAKNDVITSLISKMGKSYIHWFNAINNKPELWKPVLAKIGSNGEHRKVYWTGAKWKDASTGMDLDNTVSSYCIID